ncbi:MAG: hypothetical protein R6V04_10120 [bacterium]
MSLYGTTGYKNPELAGYGNYQSSAAAPHQQQPAQNVNSISPFPQYQGGGSQLSYGNNLNYPAYGGQGTENLYESGGQVANEAGDTAISNSQGNPYAIAAGAVSKVGGTISSIYGKYKARQEAEERYKQKLRIYEQRERERLADKAREEARRNRQEGYFASEFNQDLMDRLPGTPVGYRVGGQQ